MFTKISKPTTQGYTLISEGSLLFYDQPINYDSDRSYDGNDNPWTDILKSRSIIQKVGMTMGLLMPLTNSQQRYLNNPWTNIPKPT